MQIWIWVLVVLVKADGVEREWKSFTRDVECVEIAESLMRHREDQIQAKCVRRLVEQTEKGESQ